MPDRDLTLRDVIMPPGAKAEDDLQLAVEGIKTVVDLRGELLKRIAGFDWSSQAAEIAGKVASLLDVDLVHGVLIRVWNEGKLFQKYLNKEAYRPEDVVEVALADHTVRSNHEPYIEIFLDGVELPRMTFEVSVTLTIQGAILDIKDGKIIRLRTGKVSGKGELKYEGFLLASEKLKPIPLPGDKKLEEPIPILT
jgi:hypothetical protein